MSNTKIQEDARVRAQQRSVAAQRQNDMLAPTVEAAIPGFDGLLPRAALEAPLELEIPEWVPTPGGTGLDELLYIRLTDEAGGQVIWESPVPTRFRIPLTGFPHTDYLPHLVIPGEGNYQIGYRVAGWSGNDKFSAGQPIIVDKTPPYDNPSGPNTPAKPGLPTDVIDDEYLSNNPEVICTIPGYDDQKRGDGIYLFLGSFIPEAPDSVPPIAQFELIKDGTEDVELRIPAADIRTRPDGTAYAVYWLRDKAGNFTDISVYQNVEIQLGPLPDNLQAPEVPLAPISRADALVPVEVEIPAFDNPDKVVIRAKWGAVALTEQYLTPDPVFPLRITVPWAALVAGYDFTDLKEEQPVIVSYQAWRGTLAFPEKPLTLEVLVDLSVVGPENPDPDPVNPKLPLPELTSFSGKINIIDSDDHLEKATVTVELHDDPVDGEVVELYWRDVIVDRATLSSPTAGDILDFMVPWDAIDQGGNDPKFPLAYSIRKGAGMNRQFSPPTEVDVSVITIDLAEPEFPTMGETTGGLPIINCSSFDPGTMSLPLKIPGNSRYLKDGDTIIIQSQGFDMADLNPVTGTEFILHYDLKAGESVNGAIVRIEPYDEKLLPIGTGRLRAWYSVRIDGNPTPVPSATANPMFSVNLPDSGTCPITSP